MKVGVIRHNLSVRRFSSIQSIRHVCVFLFCWATSRTYMHVIFLVPSCIISLNISAGMWFLWRSSWGLWLRGSYFLRCKRKMQRRRMESVEWSWKSMDKVIFILNSSPQIEIPLIITCNGLWFEGISPTLY